MNPPCNTKGAQKGVQKRTENNQDFPSPLVTIQPCAFKPNIIHNFLSIQVSLSNNHAIKTACSFSEFFFRFNWSLHLQIRLNSCNVNTIFLHRNYQSHCFLFKGIIDWEAIRKDICFFLLAGINKLIVNIEKPIKKMAGS